MSRNKGKSQASLRCQSSCLNDEVKCLCQNPKRKGERRGKKTQLATRVISLKCSVKSDLAAKSFGLILGGRQNSNNMDEHVSWEPSTQGARMKETLAHPLLFPHILIISSFLSV